MNLKILGIVGLIALGATTIMLVDAAIKLTKVNKSIKESTIIKNKLKEIINKLQSEEKTGE